MPIKLTSREYKIIAAVLVIAGASLAIGVKYFGLAFPEASIDFRVNRDDSEPLAEQFLAARNFHLQGYHHAAEFGFDDNAKVYLERTQGLERMTELTRGPIHLWRWSHRWFKAQQKEEFRVDVSPAGQVVGFEHVIEETAPGAALDEAAARTMAEEFIGGPMKRNLDDLDFVESSTQKREARVDHSFIWKQRSVNLGEGDLRIEVDVDGDQVSGFREFVRVPDEWTRDYAKLRSHNDSAQMVDEVLFFLLSAALMIILVMRLRDRDVPVRLALSFGMVAALLYFFGQVNDFPLAQFGYQTRDPYTSFILNYIFLAVLSAVGVGAFIFFLVAGSEPVYREGFPELLSLRQVFSWQGFRSRSFFIANVVGIGLTFFFFAYQTIFYLVANHFGAWAPADVNYSDLLNTRIPWVWVLFMGFFPAVSEEIQFRAFAVPFLRKILRSWAPAIVLAAFIWGFLHSAYPNQPFFIRGLEVGLGGVVIGVIMMRFGVVATMIWHYSVDALYTAFLLLRSPNHYLMVSGGVTAGIMLVPLLVSLVLYLRSGTFAEEASLTNACEGISRPPHAARPAEAEALPAYTPLSHARLYLAGALIVIFVVLSSIQVYQFGQEIKLQTTRPEAIQLTDDFLRARHLNPASYHRVASLDENVDSRAVRYFLERRSVKETDEIYRQATCPLLWEVRYFRPLEKEEHLVYVDAARARVFAYQHTLDEDAPGALLSQDAALALAEKEVAVRGFALPGFDLQDSKGEKKKARQDYTFVWQARPGDPRNVDQAHYRLSVEIAGDQVVGFSRFFKLPDSWVRQREAKRVPAMVLGLTSGIVWVGLVGGAIIIFVKRLKSGDIRWRLSARVGAAVAGMIAVAEFNALSTIENLYDTSVSLFTFELGLGVGMFVIPLAAGLMAWVLAGLATSLYPDAWRIFSGKARRVWRRDALVAIAVALAAGTALDQIGDLLAERFHSISPVSISIVPSSFDSTYPAIAFLFQGLRSAVLYTSIAAVIIYIVWLGWKRREWWLGLGGLIYLVTLGPSSAHSVREYMLGWVMGLATFVVVIGILVLFFRNNILAYVGAAFLWPILSPMFALVEQPARFYVENGLLLLIVTLIVLAWMFTGGVGNSERISPLDGPAPL